LDGSIFHKTCAKCEECKCQITLSNFTKTGTTLLCKTHYFKKFHEEGTYVGGEKYAQKSGRSYSPPRPVGESAGAAPVRPKPTPVATSASSSTSDSSAASGIVNTVSIT
jgi:cysteine and glycine-rich protein